jgi:hypothetical protein
MGDFAEDYDSLPFAQWMGHMARIAYRMVVNQVRSTINFGLAGAQACALYIAFAAAAISLRSLIVAAVALSVLVLRNAHRHPLHGSPQETALDAIIAVTFGFLSQAFIGLFAPSLTLPGEIMMRGAVMSPLLICTLRMMSGGDDRPPEDLQERSRRAFRATWAMNILWLIAFLSLIVTNTEAFPASVQGRDFLFTFAPIAVFFLIYRLQMNELSGSAPGLRNRHRDELLRKRDTLWGSDRSRSSTWYASAEALSGRPAVAGWNFQQLTHISIVIMRVQLAHRAGFIGMRDRHAACNAAAFFYVTVITKNERSELSRFQQQVRCATRTPGRLQWYEGQAVRAFLCSNGGWRGFRLQLIHLTNHQENGKGDQ